MVLALLIIAPAADAAAQGPAAPATNTRPTSFEEALDLLKTNPFGSFYLRFRARYEAANIEGFDTAHAFTLRSVLGFGSRPWRGLSFHVEGENVLKLDENGFFDGRFGPRDRALVADPETTELNQFYLNYQNLDLKTELRLGRQRIEFDDQRFVGSFAFRQNEQTFDAALVRVSLPANLELSYAFLDEVHRIFGNVGPPALRDFDSNSHLARLSYTGIPDLRVTGFAYLLDLAPIRELSSASFGLRVEGGVDLTENWSLEGAASIAHQVDYGPNPRDYEANYLWLSGRAIHADWGEVEIGFERLGSDAGRVGFSTPLATAHKFSGLADAFVDNGGEDGLRDLFVSVGADLPRRWEGRLVYHWFTSDHGGDPLGSEVDLILSRTFGRYFELRFTVAYFDGASAGPPRRIRSFVELLAEF